jgi:hypothetical protein
VRAGRLRHNVVQRFVEEEHVQQSKLQQLAPVDGDWGQAPMKTMTEADIRQVAGGQVTSPELLTAPPTGTDTESNQMSSPDM